MKKIALYIGMFVAVLQSGCSDIEDTYGFSISSNWNLRSKIVSVAEDDYSVLLSAVITPLEGKPKIIEAGFIYRSGSNYDETNFPCQVTDSDGKFTITGTLDFGYVVKGTNPVENRYIVYAYIKTKEGFYRSNNNLLMEWSRDSFAPRIDSLHTSLSELGRLCVKGYIDNYKGAALVGSPKVSLGGNEVEAKMSGNEFTAEFNISELPVSTKPHYLMVAATNNMGTSIFSRDHSVEVSNVEKAIVMMV